MKELYFELPDYVRDSRDYLILENSIRFDWEINDHDVSSAEAKTGTRLPVAITVIHERKWYLRFREAILKASPDVMRTIIHHEFAHMFVAPVLRPIEYQKNLKKEWRNKISEFRNAFESTSALRHKKSDGSNLYEEGLVSYINSQWGNDEAGANEWHSLTAALSF